MRRGVFVSPINTRKQLQAWAAALSCGISIYQPSWFGVLQQTSKNSDVNIPPKYHKNSDDELELGPSVWMLFWVWQLLRHSYTVARIMTDQRRATLPLLTWFLLSWCSVVRQSLCNDGKNFIAVVDANGNVLCGTGPANETIPVEYLLSSVSGNSSGVSAVSASSPRQVLCAWWCTNVAACHSFNYRLDAGLCEFFYQPNNCAPRPNCAYFAVSRLFLLRTAWLFDNDVLLTCFACVNIQILNITCYVQFLVFECIKQAHSYK